MFARAWGSIVVALSIAAPGCRPLGGSPAQFIVRVDSVSGPGTIAPADTLTLRFWGRLGPNRCWRLDRVEKHGDAGTVELRFHGVHRRGGECLQAPASLEHEEKFPPPLRDPFTVRVLQPDGTALVKTVGVR